MSGQPPPDNADIGARPMFTKMRSHDFSDEELGLSLGGVARSPMSELKRAGARIAALEEALRDVVRILHVEQNDEQSDLEHSHLEQRRYRALLDLQRDRKKWLALLEETPFTASAGQPTEEGSK